MRSCSGFGTWSAVFPPVHCFNPPNRRGTWFQHPRIRRRPADLSPWRPPSICGDGELSFGLRRCLQKLDGFESVATQPYKTEVIWLGSRSCLQHCSKSPLLISGAIITPSSQVRNLGVVIDSELSMTVHVNNLVKVCSFHLRLIHRYLDFDAAHALNRLSYIVVLTIVTASSQECWAICSDDYRQS